MLGSGAYGPQYLPHFLPCLENVPLWLVPFRWHLHCRRRISLKYQGRYIQLGGGRGGLEYYDYAMLVALKLCEYGANNLEQQPRSNHGFTFHHIRRLDLHLLFLLFPCHSFFLQHSQPYLASSPKYHYPTTQ